MRQFLFLLLITFTGTLYLPGADGPFLFDDRTNITDNSLVQINVLSIDALYDAAFSTSAGPLGRPIANLTVALNHYFSGQTSNPTPYKLTNIVIHVINGYLVFWFAYLIIRLGTATAARVDSSSTVTIAGLVGLAWAAHPLTLTSVLYVVQRMTSLAALFSLLSLIAYIYARNGHKKSVAKLILLYGFSLLAGILAMFCKENALLVPIFALLIEFFFFATLSPWKHWQGLILHWRAALLSLAVAGALLFLLYSIHYASSGYEGRDFSMVERLLTQGRVIIFYISLILFPDIRNYALYHDDIELSTSLLEPITTLPSLLLIVAMLVVSFVLRKRHPLVGFGIMFFFSGHLLESTIFPLELIHEHRNYLPLFGAIIAMAGGLLLISSRLRAIIPVLLIAVLSSTTALRASQWSSHYSLARYSVKHHPNSAKAHTMLAIALFTKGDLAEAYQAASRAVELDGERPTNLMMKFYTGALVGIKPDIREHEKLVNHLATRPITASTENALLSFANLKCYLSNCKSLVNFVDDWLITAINSTADPYIRSYYHFLMGRFQLQLSDYDKALESFYAAFRDDPIYLQPLFEIVSLYIAASQFEDAARVLEILEATAPKAPFSRTHEIAELKKSFEIAKLKKNSGK